MTASAALVALLLLAGNAFFVGAEFAVMSARHSRVEPLAQAGSRAARRALTAMENLSLMLACAQLGVTVCSIGLGAVAEPALAHALEPVFGLLGAPDALVHPVAFVVALAVVVYLHVVLGEMVPKNLAIAGPERAALVLAPPLLLLARVLGPLLAVLNALANGGVRLLRVQPRDEVSSTFTADEVATIVTESTREGVLADDSGLVSGSLGLGQRCAGDVMVPWSRLVTVSRGVTPEQVETLVGGTGFSRFPVVDGAGDGVRGYLHLKDLLYADDERWSQPVPDKRVRSLASVAPADDVDDVLGTMQRSGSHLARVVDGHGTTQGVVFLEDLLEELVGEVRDAGQQAATVGGRAAR